MRWTMESLETDLAAIRKRARANLMAGLLATEEEHADDLANLLANMQR